MKNIQLNFNHISKLDEKFYTHVLPQPLMKPFLIHFNDQLALQMNLGNDYKEKDIVSFINGEYIKENQISSYANAYSGHQFGYFVPNLGDGRAINFGSINGWYLQTKGSGLTAYSRDGDGRAVLRSSIREYLASEAMYGLGIPTTRALGIIGSNTPVYRNYETEKASIVLRVSRTWKRFGSFEFAYMQKQNKKRYLIQLADYCIAESYSELQNVDNKYEEFYFAVVDKTIELLALWQSVGFMHGVLNTDNMSIAGLTIDYGPYAFMEEFDQSFVCNLSDHEGRYSFENQPFIAQWNLSVLAKVLSPIANHKLMESYNDTFIGRFKKRYFAIMKEKLGLFNTQIDDTTLILRMFSAMLSEKIDYTSFFYRLSKGDFSFIETHQLKVWLDMYKNRLEKETLSTKDRLEKMRKINPKYILRNYMLQDAIDAAEQGDFTLVKDFLKIAHNPYGEWKEYEKYTMPKVGWEPLKCSCSS